MKNICKPSIQHLESKEDINNILKVLYDNLISKNNVAIAWNGLVSYIRILESENDRMTKKIDYRIQKYLIIFSMLGGCAIAYILYLILQNS